MLYLSVISNVCPYCKEVCKIPYDNNYCADTIVVFQTTPCICKCKARQIWYYDKEVKNISCAH
jgi:hypothetical protein